MSLKTIAPFVVCCAVLSGCVRNHYEVVLKPEGEQMHRKVTAWRQDSSSTGGGSRQSPDTEQLTRLGKAYGHSAVLNDGIEKGYEATFGGRMPDDIGGNGSFNRIPNPMGALSVYVERFRGEDDLHARVQEIEAASDRLTDLLIGWLRFEIKDDESYGRARSFCETRIRKDIKNLGLYVMAMRISQREEESAAPELAVRISQYLVERDYFAPADVPKVLRAFHAGFTSQGDAGLLLKHAERVLARGMGWNETGSMPEATAFLADAKHCAKSFSTYLRTTPEYAELAKESRAEDEEEPREPDHYQVVGNLAMRIAGLAIFDEPDALNVKLVLPVKAFMTNGDWDAAGGAVVWTGDVASESRRESTNELKTAFSYPSVHFAFWSEPNEEYQRRHFGKPILDGERLGKYCTWYAGLTPEEARQWDAFVDGLDGESSPGAKVARFRFASEAAEGVTLAADASRLIVEGLTAAETRDAGGPDGTSK